MGFDICFRALVRIDEETGLPETERISKIVVPKEFRGWMFLQCSHLVWKGENGLIENVEDIVEWFEDLTVDDEAFVESQWEADELAEIKAFLQWMCDSGVHWIAMASY
jgi:hypothetical protein